MVDSRDVASVPEGWQRDPLLVSACSKVTMQVEAAETTGINLLELPSALLLSILQCLDVQSLCYVSRSCKLLSRLAAQPSLWPGFIHDKWVVWDVQCALARTLRLPPQVFQVQLDVKRSRRFPVTVPLHNLRPLLNITDTEGLADGLSKGVQEQVGRLSSGLWRFTTWQEYPPAASISVCRADRASVRASLRPEAVVPRLVHNLQQIGWPPSPHETAALLAQHEAHCKPTAQTAAAAAASRSAASHCPAVAVHDPSTDHQAAGCDPVYINQQQCSLGHHQEHLQQSHMGSSGWCTGSDSSERCTGNTCSSTCVQVCYERCGLMASGRLPQLALLSTTAWGSAATLSRELRDRLAVERTPAPQLISAAVDRLPHELIARESAINQLQALGVEESAARQLAPAAIKLLHVSAAADPSMLAFSLPGKPGWLLMLEKAVKVLARLHILQQVCLCSYQGHSSSCNRPQQQLQGHATGPSLLGVSREFENTGLKSANTALPSAPCWLLQQPPHQLVYLLSADNADMEAAWRQAGDRELQLCLAGFQEFTSVLTAGRADLARLYRCAQMLEAAASEYASEGANMVCSDSVAEAMRRMGLLKLQVEEEEKGVMQQLLQAAISDSMIENSSGLLCSPATTEAKDAMYSQRARSAMHVETLRAMSWCLWLLGVIE